MQRILHTELPEFARGVLDKISAKSASPKENAFILALSGNLGAGKTTLMQALAKELGVEGVVQSPTYVLMKSYPITFSVGDSIFTKLIHIDAYRLNNPEEFQTLKPEEFLHDPHNLVCVEWPEKIAGQIPKPDMCINFSSDRPTSGSNDKAEKEGARDDSRYIEVV